MEMPFIVSLNPRKADAATRTLIRSHVMRGKKKTKKCINNQIQQIAASPIKATRIKLEQAIEMYSPLTLNRIGADLPFLDLAEGIEQSILLSVMKRP